MSALTEAQLRSEEGPAHSGVSFLMVVTPRDAELARYSIRSLRLLHGLDFRWDVTVFLNGVSEKAEKAIRRQCVREPRVSVKSNADDRQHWNPEIPGGTMYEHTASNVSEMREGPYESAAAVWTRELPTLPGNYVCQIDADFEVLSPTFLAEMKSALDTRRELAVVSVVRCPTVQDYFDSYSNSHCTLAGRAATWCAMWRRACISDPPGFWYREETKPDGRIVKYDHGAYLQQALGQQGYSFAGIREITSRPAAAFEGIHYGAFSKNRSLRGVMLAFYRISRIAIFNGYIHKHKNPRIAEVFNRIGKRMYALFGFEGATSERQTYPWQ
jgi:hypothetical protein